MNTDTDGTKGDGEGLNSRKECDRRAENGREQMETDGDGRRMFENKFYITSTLIYHPNTNHSANYHQISEINPESLVNGSYLSTARNRELMIGTPK